MRKPHAEVAENCTEVGTPYRQASLRLSPSSRAKRQDLPSLRRGAGHCVLGCHPARSVGIYSPCTVAGHYELQAEPDTRSARAG
jgi:hypothetical protein